MYGLEEDMKFVEVELEKIKIKNLYMFLSKYGYSKNDESYSEDEIKNLSYHDINELISSTCEYYRLNTLMEESILSKLLRACSRILLNEESRFTYDQVLRTRQKNNSVLKLINEQK